MPRSKKRKWLWISLVLVTSLILIYITNRNGAPTTEYTTEKVTRGELRQTVSVTGSVVSTNEVELAFKNPSTITEVKVEVGDKVVEGLELVLSEASDFENQVQQAQSAYDAALATLEQMQAGAGTEEVQVAEVAVRNAQTALLAAQKRLANLQKTSAEDLASARLQVTNAESGLTAAQRNLADTIASNLQNVSSAQTAVTNAQVNLDNASTALSNTLANNDQAITSAETALSNAEDYLDSAEDYLAGVEDDYDDDLATESQVKSAQLTVTQAQNARNAAEEALESAKTQADIAEDTARAAQDSAENVLESARDSLASVQLQARMLENTAHSQVDSAGVALQIAQQNLKSVQAQIASAIENASSDVEYARGNLQSAEAQLSLTKRDTRAVDLKPQEARVKQAQASLDLAKKKLDETKIIASMDGVVTMVNAEIGQYLSPSVPVVKILGTKHLEIEANVSETDIDKIEIKDQVEITFDAFSSDEIFTGEVIKIDPDATVIQGVIYYKITVNLDDKDNSRIRSGLTTNLDIVTEKIENALQVPLRAIEKENGDFYVQVLADPTGTPSKVKVTVGLKGDNGYEMQSGLEEGQEVVTFVKEN
ncbi:MAG: efflux RND transporter periplasmic adaptor subunit [Candidatus Gracilibacteria bacterium]|nr:efflux RND transporter periplasmic adaptor subunit [Candidatus Gracilibacteria bacterium]